LGTNGTIEEPGPWLAFQALYDDPDLGLVKPDGTESQRIPYGPGNRWHPDWSPDGTALAYDYGLPEGTGQIGVLRIDGSDERALMHCVDECLGHGGPAWSPDGSSIGFDGADGPSDQFPDGLCYVGLVDVDTGRMARILEFPGCQSEQFDGLQGTGFMRFSPDGSRIVLQGFGQDDQTAIFAATIDGQDLRQLTDWGFGARPDWSPDGKWIVFQNVQPETHSGQAISLHRIRPDGTRLEQLTFPSGTVIDLYPRYVPDGSAILFSRCPVVLAPNCETRSLTPNGDTDTFLFKDFAQHGVHVIQQPTP
jgi:Tol biopolymer transport system component